MSLKIALAAIGVALISGCATTPIPLPAANGPVIVVTRDDGFQGKGCNVVISIDDQPIGILPVADSLKKEVEPGIHRVTAGLGKYANQSVCPDLIFTRLVEIKSNPAYLRFGWIPNGVPLFEQVK